MRVSAVRAAGLDPDRARQVDDLWARHGALTDAAVRQARLREVVCVVTDGDRVVGVSSAADGTVALLGGRRLWRYRRFLDPAIAGDVALEDELVGATFDALADETAGPIGLFVAISNGAWASRREASSPATQLTYVGRLPDGTPARVRYFAGTTYR